MKIKKFINRYLPVPVLLLLLGTLGACGTQSKVTGPAIFGESIPESSRNQEIITESGEAMIADANFPAKDPAVSGDLTEDTCLPSTPDKKTLEYFLRTAFRPLGSTLYVWGGGWNEEDTGAGTEAVSLGVPASWKNFYDSQNASYDYRNTRYQIHDGLDCSGFVGWAVYNTLETENGKEGYVYKSTDTAKTYSALGFGTFYEAGSNPDFLAGDICSMPGHVYISLGTCEDGSVLVLHSSPPGVRLCGTTKGGSPSMASELAEKTMKTYYSDFYERYPDCTVSDAYLKKASQMRWDTSFFPDADTIRSCSPEELLNLLERNTQE